MTPPPARRPAFLTAEWRWLLMLNYEVPPAALAPFVPRGTTLDLWEGRALASVVGFRFLRTRVCGVPVPLHRDFDEVNLRFYVRHETAAGEVRRGVTFVRELVPRRAIALVARVAYEEPYLAVPMRSTTPPAGADAPGRLAYEWRRGGGWESVGAAAVGAPALPAAGSEEEFVTEHYWGYTPRRDGGTTEYEVAHPRWRVWAADAPTLRADVSRLYGQAFAGALAAPPRSAFVAEGSAVTVYRPRRLALP
ncbi:DUF2071 domain-containing protein [Roseisolibacter sp. H3M3-2]|uniref:YqjF family protein n=1 Tax=Roseisolibacter sp. H3M3-2 TaxID=3031323 RepID=UPI0023D9A048|nr:DUF2071 domain-containing protein [Roseisolibacter sp. H3M3-2]MDF1504346.1 DUF2071 domain-containing protein [Roseisolibacter sp. H3M3-2]